MNDAPAALHVRIGKLAMAHSPTLLKATLGSCIGLAFLWRERGRYALAHCLLPEAPGPACGPGARYVDQAIDSLLQLLEAKPEHLPQIEAHVAGGGNMMQAGAGSRRMPCIGQLNAEAAMRHLSLRAIEVHSVDVGGVHARQMLLDCASATVSVLRVPAPGAIRHAQD